MAVLYAHLSVPPPSLTSRRSGLSPAIDDVLLRALAKAPEDRFASCGEFADALRLALGLQPYDSDVVIELHQRSLVDQRHRLGLDHADTLANRASSAAASREEGGSAEAIVLHRQILTDQQQTLGPDHPDTLATRFAIAQAMAARGDNAGAETALRKVLAARQRTLGRDHPDTLATQFAIARETAARGDHAAAVKAFRHVLAVRQRTLGPDHPDTLSTWFAIAREMAARGNHAAAEDHFWHLLEARQRTLGPDHPDTLATRFSIAQEMAARGEHAGAEEQFRDVLAGQARTLGSDHPDTLIVRFNIAREMAARGDHAGAEKEFRDVLPHLERRLGPDHPDTLATRFSIAQEMATRGEHAGGRGRVPEGARDPAADAGAGPPGHADHPVQHRPGDGGAREACRGRGRVPGACCPTCGEGWGPITRTRWPPGSASPGRWRRAGIMPRPRTSSGRCCPIRNGSWAAPAGTRPLPRHDPRARRHLLGDAEPGSQRVRVIGPQPSPQVGQHAPGNSASAPAVIPAGRHLLGDAEPGNSASVVVPPPRTIARREHLPELVLGPRTPPPPGRCWRVGVIGSQPSLPCGAAAGTLSPPRAAPAPPPPWRY